MAAVHQQCQNVPQAARKSTAFLADMMARRRCHVCDEVRETAHESRCFVDAACVGDQTLSDVYKQM